MTSPTRVSARRSTGGLGTPGLLVVLALAACSDRDAACSESPAALVLAERVEIVVDATPYTAEVARRASDRERGWARRRCDREALLLVPDARAPLPVWGCQLVDPVEVVLIRDGVVVAGGGRLDPCPAPCSTCRTLGEAIPVDAVLELPTSAPEASPGVSVQGVPALPAP